MFYWIQYGADVDQEDNWGVTAMYIAASMGQLEIMNYLAAAGAKPTFRSKVKEFYFGQLKNIKIDKYMVCFCLYIIKYMYIIKRN